MSRRSLVTASAIVLLASSLAQRADAQQCAGGRVATEETAGRCCWPGQRWDDAAGRCDGAPRCPEGMGGAGGTCIPIAAAPAPVPAPAPVVAAVSAPPPAASYASSPAWPAPAQPTQTVPTWGMVATGLSLFFSGWLPVIVIGTLQLTGYGPCTGWGGANYVPLLGGAISALGADVCNNSYYDSGVFLYGSQYTASGAQVIGFILFVVGLASRRPVPSGHASDWEIAPSLTMRAWMGSDASGLELRF